MTCLFHAPYTFCSFNLVDMTISKREISANWSLKLVRSSYNNEDGANPEMSVTRINYYFLLIATINKTAGAGSG